MAPPKKPLSELGRTARYLRTGSTTPGKSNPAAAKRANKKKAETDTAINKRPENLAKRRELDKARRAAVKRGANVEGKDMAHGKDGKMRLKDSSANRGDGKTTAGDRRARGKKKK